MNCELNLNRHRNINYDFDDRVSYSKSIVDRADAHDDKRDTGDILVDNMHGDALPLYFARRRLFDTCTRQLLLHTLQLRFL